MKKRRNKLVTLGMAAMMTAALMSGCGKKATPENLLKDMAKNITTAQQSVASRIREVPMRSPNLPSRGAEISADTPGTAAIIPARKAILLLSGAIDLINSARIGPIEPLHNWITRVVKNRLITSPG